MALRAAFLTTLERPPTAHQASVASWKVSRPDGYTLRNYFLYVRDEMFTRGTLGSSDDLIFVNANK